jgi:FkbM family methyltransferase
VKRGVRRWRRIARALLFTPSNWLPLARLRFGRKGDLVRLRVRDLRSAVWCRARTPDLAVLASTIADRFHLPPVALPSKPTIVDIGMHAGYTVVHYASLYPDATIVGVEMDASNKEIADRNIGVLPSGGGMAYARSGADARRPLIQTHCAAVWDSSGIVEYDASVSNWGFRVADLGNWPASQAPRYERVVAMSVASLLDLAGLERVDYLKMDVEGAEGVILRGSLDWAARVDAINVEVHPPASVDACRECLQAAGFICNPHPMHPTCLLGVRQ